MTDVTAWEYDDGGRADAGFRGTTGDCATRAIAIAAEVPYLTVYHGLNAMASDLVPATRGRNRRRIEKSSARTGVARPIYDRWLAARGWVWTPTMHIGSGTTTHLRADELPPGRLIVRLSKHLAAVIDGVVHDTHDPSRDGTRCVYGYYRRDA